MRPNAFTLLTIVKDVFGRIRKKHIKTKCHYAIHFFLQNLANPP